MYGTVNQAILSYLVQKVGEEAKASIQQHAGVTQEFLGMEQYPDEDSVALVVAAAEHLGLEPGQVLVEIGEHWVDFALTTPFANHLRMAGSTYLETIQGLDDMHVRLSQDFDGYEPPSFAVDVQPDGTLQVHYRSVRAGLAPLAEGILRRLAVTFDEDVEIELRAGATDQEALFLISGVAGNSLRKAS